MDSFGLGLGLAWTFQWTYSILVLSGALLGLGSGKDRGGIVRRIPFSVASGLIAGGTLIAVVLAFWETGPDNFPKFTIACCSTSSTNCSARQRKSRFKTLAHTARGEVWVLKRLE